MAVPAARLAVIVATRNRPSLLRGLLSCLERQTLPPVRVVIVDSSDVPLDAEGRASCSDTGLDVCWVSSSVRSSATQRNIALDILCQSTDPPEFVAILDDDTRPAPAYLAQLVARLRLSGAAGAAGTTGWAPPPQTAASVYRRIFRLESRKQGCVLRSGIAIAVDGAREQVVPVAWLIGCSMWRFNVLRRYRYDDRLVGAALAEDVQLSARIGREHELLVDTAIQLEHEGADEGRPGARLWAHRSVRNRAVVVGTLDLGRGKWVVYWWSVLGQLAPLVARYAASRRSRRARIQYQQERASEQLLLQGVVSGIRAVVFRAPPI